MRFVIATGNRNKLREFRAILAPSDVVAMPATIVLPPEGIKSFRANAVQKARALAEALLADPRALAQVVAETGGGSPAPEDPLIVLADDSGLEVEALRWAPGVTSARFAGEGAGDAANTAKLLSQLEGYSSSRRRARFVCVVAAVVLPSAADVRAAKRAHKAAGAASTPPSQTEFVAHAPALSENVATGEWWGSITTQPRGEGGFGYDPVFLPVGSELTVAELPPEVKDQASHRALAGKALLELLHR